MPVDLNKTELEVLVEKINKVNFTNIDFQTVTVGQPIVNTGGNNNTKILVTGKPNTNITGSVLLSYNRKDINTIIGDKNRVFIVDGALTTRDLLSKINSEYNINLDAEDIVSVPLPAFVETTPGQTTSFTLTIDPGSLLYTGTTNLFMRGRELMLNTIITNTDLGDALWQ